MRERERERVRFKERGLGGYAGYTTVRNPNKCGLGHAYGNMHNLREWKCDKHPWLWSVVCAYRKTRKIWGASGFPCIKHANSLLPTLCKRERLAGVATSVSWWSHGRSKTSIARQYSTYRTRRPEQFSYARSIWNRDYVRTTSKYARRFSLGSSHGYSWRGKCFAACTSWWQRWRDMVKNWWDNWWKLAKLESLAVAPNSLGAWS